MRRHRRDRGRDLHVGDRVRALGELDGVHAERLGDRLERADGGIAVELHLAGEEQLRLEQPHRDVGVGHRRHLAAAAVARRARRGARGLRPDLERAHLVGADQAAAARADAADVERGDRQRDRVLELPLVGDLGAAVEDDPEVRAGAADVEADEVAAVEQLARVQLRAEQAGDRAGLQRVDRRALDGAARAQAAVHLHDLHARVEAGLGEALLEALEVAHDGRAGVGVEHHDERALELAGQRPDARVLHVGVRHDLLDDLAHALLVVGVVVGVEEADADGLDALGLEELELAARGVLVERQQDVAVLAQALRDLAAVPALDDRARDVRALPRRVVEVLVERAPDAAVVDGVAVALGHQHPRLRALAGQRRVEPHGVAVVERRDRLGVVDQPLERGERPLGLVVPGREDLGAGDLPAVLVDQDGIREGASHVYSNSNRHDPLSSRSGPHSSRARPVP